MFNVLLKYTFLDLAEYKGKYDHYNICNGFKVMLMFYVLIICYMIINF